MKTFTKHILLLALMLFGVAGAAWAQTVFTTLQEGDVIHVGDQFNPSQLCLIQQNSDYIVTCMPGSYGNVPLTLVRANIADQVVTESATGAYFLFRASNGSYHFTDEGKRIAATENSDGLVVTELGTNSGYPLVTLAVHFPDPYAPALDETTGHWNFLMPGANKVVKAVLYDSIVLGPHVELYDADPAFAAGDIYTRGDSTIYYYDTNNHHSFYLRADEQAGGKYFGYWSDLDPTDYYYTDRTYRRVSTGSFTCGQRFTAAYADNYTLNLNPSAGGTLELAGVTNEVNSTAISFTVPSSWNNNETPLTVDAFPGFVAVSEEQARNWTDAPQTGYCTLFYDTTSEGSWKTLGFVNGNIYSNESDYQYQNVYNTQSNGSTVVYTTGGSNGFPYGVVPPEKTYNITFSGFNASAMNTTVSVTSLPQEFTQIGGQEITPSEVFGNAEELQFEHADVYGGNYKVYCSTPYNMIITVSDVFEGTATIHVEGRYYDPESGDQTIYKDITVTCEAVRANGPYQVMEGLTVNVTATPDSAHYLASIDGHDTVGNYATGYSFVMPSSDKDLLAVFNAKPTLTLTQTDGGTLAAIVPQGVGEETLLTTVTATGQTTYDETTPGIVTVTLDNLTGYNYIWGWLYSGSVTVEAAQGYTITRCVFKQNPSSTPNRVLVDDLAPFTATMVGNNDGGTDVSATTTHGDEIGDDFMAGISSIEVYGYQNSTANVIASSTPNTYIIDYGTPVTVVATPDAQHYLVNFDGTDVRNDNDTAFKTYDSVIAPFTSTANFQAKPVLTLTANDGGTLTLDGMVEPTPAIATIQFAANGNTVVRENVTLPHTFSCSYSYENGELDQIIKSLYEISSGFNNYAQTPTASGNDNVTAGKSGDDHWITISAPFDGTATVTGRYWKMTDEETDFEYNLTITILSSTPGTPGLPAGVVSANATLDTFVVDYNTEVTVVATPDATHYLATLGGVTMGSNTAKDTTFAVTATTNLAANFTPKPTLTLAHNDGGEMEVIVPESNAVWGDGVSNLILANNYTADGITFTSTNGSDIPNHGQWFAYSSKHLHFTSESGNFSRIEMVLTDNYDYTNWNNAEGWTVDANTAVWEGDANEVVIEKCTTYVKQITFVRGAANVIASTTEPNTYYIDYNTSVTVKATPDATHYLVNFDGTDVRNDNDTAFKTYDSVIAPFTSTANFQAKPTLTLTANDGGTLTLDGMGGTTLTLISYSNTDLPGYQSVSREEARALCGTDITSGTAYVFYRNSGTNYFGIKFQNGVEQELDIAVSLDGINYFVSDPYDEGLKLYYTTGHSPAGVTATETENQYRVDYGTEVTVTATPDATHYLATLGGVTMGSNTAKDTTFALTATTNLEANFTPKPTLTLAHNDGGEMEIVPEEVMAVNEFTVPSSWNNDNTLAAATDLPSDFQSVSEAEATAWQNTTGHPVYLFFKAYASGTVAYVRFNANGTVADVSTGLKSVIYNNVSDVYEGYLVRYTTVGAASNFIASTAEPNTYIIDYNTSVTVKATPSDTAYLVRFDQDDDTNSNTAVEKLYGPLTAALTTAEATFNAKPVLTLAANDTTWGKVSIVSDGEEVTIGNGTSTSYVSPYHSLWGYSFVESLYTAEEIGTAGTITSISYNMNFTEPQTNDFVIYMKNVSRSTFASPADYEPVTDADIVYSGSVTFDNGWTTITLGTPFEYDGTSNLMIAFDENTNSYSTRYFYYTENAGMVLTYHSDSKNPDPYDLGSYTGNKDVSMYRANIKFGIAAALPAGVAQIDSVTYRVDYGTSVTVVAVPDTAHYLVRFDNDADTNSNVAVEKTYQNITADVTSEALFAPKPKLTLAKTRTMEATDDWGSVSFNPLQYPYLGSSQNTGPLFLTDEPDVYVVDYGATVTVTADATELHHVANWVDADSAAYPADRITYSAYFVTEPVALFPDSSTLTLTITADTTAKAVFGINSYDVFATAQFDDRDEIGTGTAMGYLNVSYKDIVGTTQTAGPEDTLDYTAQGGSLSTISSTSYYGYRFSGWYDADMDTLMSSVNPLTLTEAAVVEARYTPINYTVTGLSEDDEMGTVTGGGTQPYRTPVSLTAVPERGYHFTGWDNGLSANPLELAAMSDFTVTASFAPNQYTVTALSGDETMGSASGSTVADFHTTVTLTATPNAHYHFVAWSNGVTDTVTELLVDGDTTVTALFAADEYTITGLSADSTMGSVSGSATVTYPATVTLTAVAADCHHFVQWNDGVTANPRTVNALEDLTLTATFAASTYASSEDVTTCDSYTWNNVTYTASGTYTYNTTTLAGCDSTATLHLTLITGIETEEVVEACESYEWHGVVYTQSTGILGAPTYTTTALNGCDSTVTLRLTINHGTTAVETVEACDSYTWNGRTYFSSTTTATYTTEGSNGCDSTTTLHLTLGRSTSGELNVEACESYTWHGVTYTESIVGPTDTNLNTSGCPHVTTLHLTILRNSSSEETVEACDVYNWHGVNRYASGDYVFLSPNAVGCDSTAILHLTILRSTHAEEIAAACDEYEWHGILFTESADTTLHTLNAAGCDSAMTLHLTLYYNSEATDVVTACDSYTWIDGVTYTASTDEPTYTLSGANCSTTVTLNLTVNYSTAGIDEQEAVDSYTWINGITYTASTDQPTFVLTNAAGCDSVVTLHLTITYTPEPVYYNVTLATADATMGSVAPAGTTVIEEGLSFTATATALTGRHFVAWVSNGTVVSNANPYTFVVNDDVELTATFDYDEVIAVLTVNDETMGTTTPAPGTYTFHVGDEATVTATANEHYHFVGWTVNGTPINTQETTYTVTVTPEMAGTTFYVEAVFAQNEGIDDNEGILEATIYAQEGQIVVEGAGNSTVVLYDVTGRRLAVKHSDNAPLRFDIAVSGTYLVKVGNAPAKRIVMVR